MAKRSRKRPGRVPTDASQPTRGASLGDLLRAEGLGGGAPQLPEEEAGAGAPAPPDAGTAASRRADVDLSACGPLRLRREKKRRAGKTVTLLQGLERADLPAVARAMRRALGCGASVEGDQIVLQGDMTTRARAWLLKRGARDVRAG